MISWNECNFHFFLLNLEIVLDYHYMYFIVLHHVYTCIRLLYTYFLVYIMLLYHDTFLFILFTCNMILSYSYHNPVSLSWLLQEIVTRLGRWIDFENDYKTMYPTFMESIWWVFKELYNRGLVYKGSKVMPFSTACNTPLSNFESGQNYKDVVDPAGLTTFIQWTNSYIFT